jgi:cephalosporin hydroxylase/HEAT repeat protein
MVSKSLSLCLTIALMLSAMPLHAEKPIPWKRIVDRFHQVYHNGGGKPEPTWLGVETGQTPNDQWVMQEIIQELKPGSIIEIGTARGGSALYMSSLLGMVRPVGKILTMDVESRSRKARKHAHWVRRVKSYRGDSLQPKALRAALGYTRGPVMVIIGRGSSREHVLRQLELYSRFVSVGSYMIVRDTNLHGLPVDPEHGRGPWEAVEEFLAGHPEFGVDERGTRFHHSGLRGGVLKKSVAGPTWGKNRVRDFGRAAQFVKAVEQEGLNELPNITRALHSGPEIVRWYAADLLGSLPGEKTEAALIRTLEDKSVDVRRRALESLRRLKAESAVDAIAKLLTDRKLGPTAALALREIGVAAQSHVPTLIEIATDKDRNTYWRAMASEAIGFVGKSIHVRDIVPLLKRPSTPEYLRARICVALGHIGGPGGVSALMIGVREGSDMVAYHCAVGLGQQKYKMGSHTLVTTLQNKERYLARIGAAQALAMIGRPRPGKAMAEVAMDRSNEASVREAVVRGLAQLKTRIGFVRQSLEDPDFRVRIAAAKGLGELKDKESLDALGDMVGDEHEGVRLAAVGAIGRIGGPKAKTLLRGAAENGDKAVQIAAKRELNR